MKEKLNAKSAKSAKGRKGDWIQTFTGKKFWPLDPRIDEIEIDDIAHALSLQCRFGGHIQEFYSVAQHCVLASEFVNADYAFEALMHDASEAYLVDLCRPVKYHVAGYREAEDALMQLIAQRYSFQWPPSEHVALMDQRLLATEASLLLPGGPKDWSWDWKIWVLPVEIVPMSPREAETRFLARFYEFSGIDWGMPFGLGNGLKIRR
jgi:hypothetical protein